MCIDSSLSELVFTHFKSFFSFDCFRFSAKVLNVYKNGLIAEFKGNAKIASATLTSLEIGKPAMANMPHSPMGNQHMKSVTATVINLWAMITSRDTAVVFDFKEFIFTDQ